MKILHRRAFVLFAVCFSFVASSSSFAETVTPFNTFNQSPIIQVHGLPAIDSAKVLSENHGRYRLIADISNNLAIKQLGNESGVFDGETTRLTFSYSQGMGNDFEWGVQIPYVSHEGGSLDAFIEDWHDTFGLPQNNRDKYPRNRLTYVYSRNGDTLLDITNATSGIGDIRVNGAWQLQRTTQATDANYSLRASLSLPTGDSKNLTGNGGIDAALWLSADRTAPWFNFPGNSWGGFGILFLGDGDVLVDQQQKYVLFGSIGAGAKVWSKVSLKLQLDMHTTMYNKSSLKQINGNAVQLIMGGDIALDKNTRIDLAIKEDPTVFTSPDVVFHIGLTINN